MKSDENFVHTITRNTVPIKLAIRSFKAYAKQFNKNMKKKKKKTEYSNKFTCFFTNRKFFFDLCLRQSKKRREYSMQHLELKGLKGSEVAVQEECKNHLNSHEFRLDLTPPSDCT